MTAGTGAVLVTGGAGFIGRRVVATLLAAGRAVTVLDSLRADVHRDGRARGDAVAAPGSGPASGARAAGRGAAGGAEVHVADVRDPEAVDAALQGTDVVVHLAAKVGLGVDLDDMDDYVGSNCLGTAVLLRSMARRRVRRLVLASSMVVYGEGRYDCRRHGRVTPGPRRVEDLAAGRFEPRCPHCDHPLRPGLVDEDAPADPRNTYAATKLHGEHLAATWARETGGSAVALRFHNVYGPGMPRNTPYAGVAAIFRSALDDGQAPRVFEDGGQRRDFVHVEDVAAAVVRAATTPDLPPFRAYNVGSGAVHTIGDLAHALAEASGGRSPVVTGEYRLGDVRHVTASSDRIATELGWRARVGLERGIADLVAASAGPGG